MSAGIRTVADAVALLLVVCLAGLLLRRRTAAAPCFVAYLVIVLSTNRLIVWWPETFYRTWFWNAKEVAIGLLKLAVVLDLAAVAFAGWPRARRVARAGLSTAIGAALVLPLAFAYAGRRADPMLAGIGWLQAGTAWAFVALLALAHWYRLPLHGLHRAIITGFVLYLAVYAVALDLLRVMTWTPTLAAIDPIAYAATVGLWAIEAWRPERLALDDRAVLYPWARP